MRDNKTYYDEFANWYEKQRHQGYHALIDDIQFGLIRELAAFGDVLEVGCGTGLIMQRVKEVARSVKGVDISPGMLETARERGLDVLEGEATSLPFEANTFDLVYSFKVLAHVKEIERALEEAVRVTRPGGYLVLDFYNKHSLRYLAKRLGGPGMISEKTDEGALFTRWDTPEEVIARMPQNVHVENVYGVRVVTPFAGVYKIPVVSSLMGYAEELLVAKKPFCRFGGFFVVKMRKSSE